MMKDWSLLEIPGQGAYSVPKPVRELFNSLIDRIIELEKKQSANEYSGEKDK